jgi:hypothetical protein
MENVDTEDNKRRDDWSLKKLSQKLLPGTEDNHKKPIVTTGLLDETLPV